MIPISSRYMTAVTCLTALVLVPVLIHSYAQVRIDECDDPEQLLGFAESKVDTEEQARIKKLFDAEQSWSGTIPMEGGLRLNYAVIRSYNAKRLYYRPERRYLKDSNPDAEELEWIETNDGILLPIHRSFYSLPSNTSKRVLAYLVVYNGRPVVTGELAQLRSAPSLLLRGAKPMSLFLVWGDVEALQTPETEERARHWLQSAWRSYRDHCVGS